MKNNRKSLVLILIVTISIISFVFIFQTKVIGISETKSHYIYLNDDIGGTSTDITKETTLVQEFKCDESFSGFRIYFGQNNHGAKGTVKVTLENQKSEVIQTFEMNSSDIKTDQYNVFYMDNSVNNNSENIYRIVINADSQDIIKSSRDMYKDGNLYINGQKQDSDICFNLISTDSFFIVYFYIAISVILISSIGLIFYFLLFKNFQVENLFLVCAIFTGITYMIVFTPYSISDESKHINTAYRYSNVLTFSGGYRTGNGDMLKRSEDMEVFGLRTTPSLSTYYVVFTHIFDIDKSNKMLATPGETLGNICQYIPTAVGMTVARIYKLGYIALIHIARIYNLSFFILMAYLAIKKAPFGKMIFFITAMLPMTMQRAASCSYDAIVNGVGLLFIAYTLNIAFKSKKLKKVNIITLLILGGVFVAAKAGIYIFVLMLLLIIPKEKFKNNKAYFLSLGGLMIATVAILLYFNSVKLSYTLTMSGNELEEFNYKISYPFSYIFSNPLGFIKLFFNTIIEKTGYYISSLIGGQLRADAIKIPNIITISFVLLLGLSAIKRKEENQYLSRYAEVVMGIIITAVFIAFHFAALTWTPYGDSVIYGVDGRYFLISLVLFMYIVRNNLITIKMDISKFIIGATTILNIITITCAFISIIA